MSNDRKFLVESSNGYCDFSNSTTRVWTLEEMLREINRDTTCTDSDGNICLAEDNHADNSGCCVMAGSPMDTVDHENNNCYQPYNADDWEEGWYNWNGEEYNRIVREVTDE
jgi:hypothetical protein